MSNVTIAVDLAKDVFEIAVANRAWKIVERKRLTRARFERFWQTRQPCAVVMEACGTAHHWARQLIALGFEVRLLPAHEVRRFRGRNKTDRTDCEALLDAARSPRIKAVGVKSPDQQQILALHRVREQWKRMYRTRLSNGDSSTGTGFHHLLDARKDPTPGLSRWLRQTWQPSELQHVTASSPDH
jgi:transposase